MFNLFVFMSVVLTNICPLLKVNVCYSSNPDFSSKYDPEECYSAAKSFGDVGVFPDRDYDGTGIRIGIIENGIPYNTSILPSGSQCYGNTYSSHCDDVISVLAGEGGLVPNATFFIASKSNYDFEDCLRWLVEDMHVHVINHSGGHGGRNGYYTYGESAFIDSYIINNNVIFVNALGNHSDNTWAIPSIALGINVLSIGATNRNLDYSNLNVEGIYDDVDLLIQKPNVSAPGEGLYGFSGQSLNTLDTVHPLDALYNGTSFSAPIVTGIIALLLEEFPSLPACPETIHAILKASSKNGIVNYENARKIARNYCYHNYSVFPYDAIGTTYVDFELTLPQYASIHASNFVLFNGVYNHPYPNLSYVNPSEILFSRFKITLESAISGLTVCEIYGDKSSVSLEYTNNSVEQYFRLKVILYSSKAPTGTELSSFAYRIEYSESPLLLTTSNFNIDTLPTLSWVVDSYFLTGTTSIVFYNFRNQIILSKTDLSSNGSLQLTKTEWNSLLSLRGREFYAVLFAEDNNNTKYYSEMYVLNEPKTFGFLSNINPVDFGFPDAYNYSQLMTYKVVDGINITIERLRCGYIQEQYINLSSKRSGAGHAYLKITFDKLITYCAFGFTLWRDHELALIYNDTAVIRVMDEHGIWVEYLDLLTDISLPDSRKDIVRFDATNIRGIWFDVTSIQGGNRNKGRLCLDNISFTDDINVTNNNYVCSYIEPIVIREDFSLPTD